MLEQRDAARCSAMQRMLRGQHAGSHQASEASRVKNMASNPALEALIPMSCGVLETLMARRTDATSESGNKGMGKGTSKDQAGLQLCYSWSTGCGPRADVPPGEKMQVCS